MSTMSSCPYFNSIGNTPLLQIRKLVKPHKISTSLCQIHAKCEFRNPSGSIWDRLVSHEIKNHVENCPSPAFIAGGISDLCLSLAWAGVAVAANEDVSIAVLPGPNMEDCKYQLLQGLGANVILSYGQDPNRKNNQECLESHMQTFETTSRVPHHKIMPFALQSMEESSEPEVNNMGPYDTLIDEVVAAEHSWDAIVCSGQDKRLLLSLRKRFPILEDTYIIGVDFTGNAFTETLSGDVLVELAGIKTVQVSDAECYDMARRLIREEGLTVGPLSGGVMAAAMKEILSSTSTPPPPSILVILPDSLQNTSKDFLSVDWMVQKGYYSVSHLESLFWWYEMAIENLSPPEVLIAQPETSLKCVHAAMTASSTERCVVVTPASQVIGVITRDAVVAKNSAQESTTVGDACTKQFGTIDSKASFSELERLLRKYNWVVNIHRVPIYGPAVNTQESTTSASAVDQQVLLQTKEDVLGAINMADFIRYKRKVEMHHLTEYGLAMSDGVPSDVWLERLNEHFNISTPN